MNWNDEALAKYMQIRYIKLHFALEILEDGHLPKSKASMLRGGMGDMLLMMNCVRDSNHCEACDFSDECLAQRMLYAPMKIRPKFMTGKDSEGYVIECEDTDEEYAAGDELEFNLLLFGSSIVYFSQFVQAFHSLGMAGLGKERLRYRIARVTNTNRELLLEDGIFRKDRYRIRRVEEYVRYRMKRFEDGQDALLVFHTPLSMKYRGDFLNTFEPLPILTAAERRLYILNCFEGRSEGEDYARVVIGGKSGEEDDVATGYSESDGEGCEDGVIIENCYEGADVASGHSKGEGYEEDAIKRDSHVRADAPTGNYEGERCEEGVMPDTDIVEGSQGSRMKAPIILSHVPEKVEERVFRDGKPRFSGTQNRKMVLRGIRGSCKLTGLDQTALALLFAGELLHIGKNTNFGFGRYTVKRIEEV